MSVTASRMLALSALEEIRRKDAWAHSVVDGLLSKSELSISDRAHATRLVYGTVETIGTLDEAIDRLATRPSAIQPEVRDILRVAAWELLFGESEAHATVHQAVEAVTARAPHATGFANAILRKIAAEAESFPWGDPDTDDSALARKHGHPLWLVEQILEAYPRSLAVSILEAANAPAPLYLAHNPFKGTFEELVASLAEEGAQPIEGPILGCITCGAPAPAVRSAAVRDGAALVVDASAQLVSMLAAPGAEEWAVDLAAGRGSKTALMQAAAAGEAHILATDLHEFKVGILSNRMEALGVPGVVSTTADGTDSEAVLRHLEGRQASKVLVDAPCSGIGALRRTPDKRWKLRPEEPPTLAHLGSSLLSAAADLVRPGGVVVYSTCTILPVENQMVVDEFLASEAGAEFSRMILREAVPLEWQTFLTEQGDFQSVPLKDGPDGHFASVLARSV